jgi:glucose/arabinose dehydrogenase
MSLRILRGALCAFTRLCLGFVPSRAADAPAELKVPPNFSIEIIAHVASARELAIASNGDLFVGTEGRNVMLVPGAEGTPQAPRIFVELGDAPAAGVALGEGALYAGTFSGVWRVPYVNGKRSGGPVKIASVRLGGGRGHLTTSVASAADRLYASVGSSCNACTESDPTRATIQEMEFDGRGMHAKAVHIRNAIALAVNPASGAVWAGVAGQDELEPGHPYEDFDPFTLHAGTPDYGWPVCYENHKAKDGSRTCSDVVIPRVVFPAYNTPIGATFYPLHPTGKYAFPAEYAGGAFVALHGSWHEPLVPPRVAFVAIKGDEPLKPVDWSDPSAQWREFVGGFQRADESRIGRPTGIAVGPEGSLFVADDQAGVVYRIRPKVH